MKLNNDYQEGKNEIEKWKRKLIKKKGEFLKRKNTNQIKKLVYYKK